MTHNSKPVANCCAIILAAGQSSRMGSPKQLLRHQGKTLLQHSINVAREANVHTVLLVLGANKNIILDQTDIKGVHVVENQAWQTGMASSIVAGISPLKDIDPQADGVLLIVCDQPLVSSSLLNELMDAQQQSSKAIAASRYQGTLGVPALFHKSLFAELMNLKGDQGARKLIHQYQGEVAAVDFPGGSIDIDTMDEYEKLR